MSDPYIGGTKPPSKNQDLPVFCRLEVEVRDPLEHVGIHVREHHSPAVQLSQMAAQGREVKMIPDPLLEEVGLANKHVGAPRRLDKGLSPLGVARVSDGGIWGPSRGALSLEGHHFLQHRVPETPSGL